jgi:N-acetylmuramoyl-L-alanine amidase
MRRFQICFFLLFLLSALSAFGQSTRKTARTKRSDLDKLPDTYLVVPAKTGDDVDQLLERYELSDFECDYQKFLEINELKGNVRLKGGFFYKLPILVVDYNGKSIRSTLGIDDWRIAQQIGEYNRKAQSDGWRDDNFVVSRNLWVPLHQLECPDAIRTAEGTLTTEATPAATAVNTKKGKKIPVERPLGEQSTVKGKRIYPIFGKKYENTPLISQKLKGKVFYLVSGHGGPDVGAQGRRAGHTLCEDEYAYDVTLRLLRLLLSHGATVFMIVRDPDDGIRDEDFLNCDKDEVVLGDLTVPLPQRERLQQRTDLINELTAQNLSAGVKDQTMIEIHVDSRSSNNKIDVFFYYRPESDISKSLALKFQRLFQQKYAQIRGQRGYSGSVSPRYLFMLKETTVPRAVYLELGNIRNELDQQRLVLKNNRQAIANWLTEALLNDAAGR